MYNNLFLCCTVEIWQGPNVTKIRKRARTYFCLLNLLLIRYRFAIFPIGNRCRTLLVYIIYIYIYSCEMLILHFAMLYCMKLYPQNWMVSYQCVFCDHFQCVYFHVQNKQPILYKLIWIICSKYYSFSFH